MYRLFTQSQLSATERRAIDTTGIGPDTVRVENCHYAESARPLSDTQVQTLGWLTGGARPASPSHGSVRVEIGSRRTFASSWSTTATEICRRAGLDAVRRLDKSRIYIFPSSVPRSWIDAAVAALHDPMTQEIYEAPIESFDIGGEPEPVREIPLLTRGPAAVEAAAVAMGLAMDRDDLEHCIYIFLNVLRRNPTDVELFQIGQANSEHSRHHFFRAHLVIDGVEQSMSLMDLIKAPYKANPANSVIAFHDDSSAIEGARALILVAQDPTAPSALRGVAWRVLYTMTAETHNFPTGIAPFPGAATGTGGRIRDNESVGRGGRTSASLVGYATGDWRLLDATRPWERGDPAPAIGLKSPLEIILGATAGAWAYGNSFGEPVIGGWTRTLDMDIGGTRYAYLRPILYSAGMGFMREEHADKDAARSGMLIVQIGGPAYPIGVGGGAASSRQGTEGSQKHDFEAVQRGDPATAEVVGRVIDACIAMGAANPIRSAHDLGAGGDSNALPEIVDPAGAVIELRNIPSGDSTMSVLTLWGNEAQERIAVLVWPKDLAVLVKTARREGAVVAVVGTVTGSGELVVYDRQDDSTPVRLPLNEVLGDVPKKRIQLATVPREPQPFDLSDISFEGALERVLALPAVASKWGIILGVDRCVTGLIAQQQCVGPDHVPVSDYSIVADSYYGHTGRAHAIGERPLVGLISPAAQGRMTVGEAVTNLMGAVVESLPRVRASVNVMSAARQPGEGAKMFEAYTALSDLMVTLGMAADGGKDSLSMAAQTSQGVARGAMQLVVASYAAMPDVRVKVTPDLKHAGNELILVDLSGGRARLGGSALGQVFNQIGDEAPDLDDAGLLARAFAVVQRLVKDGQVLAIHDRSDGGLIVTVLEMAFAGLKGIDVSLDDVHGPLQSGFCEELGVVIECADTAAVRKALDDADIPHMVIGRVDKDHGDIVVRHRGKVLVNAPMLELRQVWESTGAALDRLQTDPTLVRKEVAARGGAVRPKWQLSFVPEPSPAMRLVQVGKPRVAILREVGTNGDRELAAAFEAAGFEPWDIVTSDLIRGRATLDEFRGLAMAGGFSFGDVLGAGVGWAAEIMQNPIISKAFKQFVDRRDTFSLGVCNGAQLATRLSLVGPSGSVNELRLTNNTSERFECRFVQVEIQESPAIMLANMAGSRLGIWIAHGEGRFSAKSSTMEQILDQRLAPIRYIDPDGSPTTDYPFNPNGSPAGIAAVCSPDGRHLAMMPHPERLASQLWQWPYLPEELQTLAASPWLRMFQNAYAWCAQTETQATKVS